MTWLIRLIREPYNRAILTTGTKKKNWGYQNIDFPHGLPTYPLLKYGLCRAGIRYSFGTGGMGIRYWKTFIQFRYFGTFLKRVIQYRYFGILEKTLLYVKPFK